MNHAATRFSLFLFLGGREEKGRQERKGGKQISPGQGFCEKNNSYLTQLPLQGERGGRKKRSSVPPTGELSLHNGEGRRRGGKKGEK